MNAMGRRDFGEVPVCSTIDVRYGDDVRARRERLQNGRCSSRTGGEGKSISCMFKCCNGFLKVIPRITSPISAPETDKERGNLWR